MERPGNSSRGPCIILILFCTIYSTQQLREIRLQGFLPMTGTGWPIGGACLPAALMAVRHVNKQAGLLDGYNVTFNWVDSKCDAGEATFQLFQVLGQPPIKNMVLGCACSVASMPTAEVSHLFNITQISYGSTSPALSNRKRFPNFYQLDIPDHAINPAKIALMREFNWRKVASINQAIEYHSLVIDDFVESVADTEDITVISQEIFEDDLFRRVENLKKRDARIILVQMYGDKARMMLCAAYKLGLYGPKIVFIFNNWYIKDFWRPQNEVPCTEEEMQAAIEGAFLMGSFVRNPRSERGVAGLTEFDDLYRQEETYDTANEPYYICAPFIYDCVWIAALALNCTESHLRATGFPKYLDEFTYQDSDINDVILSCMNNISLIGVSGRISYSGGAAPVNKNIKIERVQNSKLVMVGTYIMDEEVRRFEWIKGALQWKDNQIPRDSTHIRYEEVTISVWLYVVMSVCAGIGLLLVVGCFLFNMMYRQHRIVKVSSPNVNSVLLLGCVLIYSTVFMNTAVSEVANIVCKPLTDCQVIGLVCVFAAVILVLVIIWETTSPQFLLKKELFKEVYITEDDAEVRPFIRVCDSKYGVYFSWSIYIIIGAVLVLGSFLAWETRNFQVETLNDSYHIGLCLYNTMVLSIFGLTVYLLLEDSVIVVYAVTSSCLILGTTMNIGILFVPKVLACRQSLSSVEPLGGFTGKSGLHVSFVTTPASNNCQGKESETVTDGSLPKPDSM